MSFHKELMIAGQDASVSLASSPEVVCNVTEIGEKEPFATETFIYYWLLGFEKLVYSRLFGLEHPLSSSVCTANLACFKETFMLPT